MAVHFGHYFRILHSCADTAMTNDLAAMDLTAAQGHILGYLAHCSHPPCPRDIEETFQLSHPTVSGLLQRLEKKGFIQLRTDEQDRRCKRIFVLEKGRQVQSAMHQAIMQMEQQLVQGFTEDEKELFAHFLERSLRNMGEPCCKRKPKEVETK